MAVRRASHANSWYTGDGGDLGRELESWLTAAARVMPAPARAIICPHAGYRYSGATAAHSFRQVSGEDGAGRRPGIALLKSFKNFIAIVDQ